MHALRKNRYSTHSTGAATAAAGGDDAENDDTASYDTGNADAVDAAPAAQRCPAKAMTGQSQAVQCRAAHERFRGASDDDAVSPTPSAPECTIVHLLLQAVAAAAATRRVVAERVASVLCFASTNLLSGASSSSTAGVSWA